MDPVQCLAEKPGFPVPKFHHYARHFIDPGPAEDLQPLVARQHFVSPVIHVADHQVLDQAVTVYGPPQLGQVVAIHLVGIPLGLSEQIDRDINYLHLPARSGVSALRPTGTAVSARFLPPAPRLWLDRDLQCLERRTVRRQPTHCTWG